MTSTLMGKPIRRGRRHMTTVLLDPEVMDRIDGLARQRDVSRADVIREMVKLGLEQYDRQRAVLAAAS